ncbi:peptidoglycan-binding protein LysM [Basfia succiniciproducens]|uniref:peptidoglycan-binding protein LysM n=1 Tax=Basfia succiniciproducens TaxID=653940 RepID=UPI0008B38E33|nr:peptidoglycan-binding protein LysM [Basfia succiniciproducens]SEQ76643.1 Transglycosylase-like domain-containing protein [Basfia succiniciproducens]
MTATTIATNFAVEIFKLGKGTEMESKDLIIAGLTVTQTKALLKALAKRESAGNYKAENSYGYLGAYQFGAAALVDVGLINQAKYNQAVAMTKGIANGSSPSVHKGFLASESNWTIRGGKDTYLNNPQMQDESIVKLMNRNARYLTSKGVYSGSVEHKAGLLFAAHLKGAGNALKFAKGGVVTKDGYGTSIKDYYDLGAKSVRGV